MALGASFRRAISTRTTLRASSGGNVVIRHFHQTTSRIRPADEPTEDEKSASSSSSSSSKADKGAPKPKISNLSVPGVDTSKDLTEAQRKEVEEHNRQFDEKFDHGAQAPKDKVDKKFWRGGGTRG